MGHTLFWTTIILWVLADLYLVFFHNRGMKRNNPEKKSKYIVIGLILFGIFGGQYIDSGSEEAFYKPFTPIRYLSLPIIWLGIIIRLTAVLQLGKAFSGNLGGNEENTVHKEGLYSIIRHPSYSGLIIAFAGIALALYHPITSSMTILFPLLAFLYRISLEEKILIEEFGQEYRDYATNTKKLIPYIL